MTYFGELKNNETFEGKNLSSYFSIIVYKCPDASCKTCQGYNETELRGICTECTTSF